MNTLVSSRVSMCAAFVLLLATSIARWDTQDAVAMANGHSMTNAQDRQSGIVRMNVFGDGGFGVSCTASILKTSKITDDTWLLTAAHCFYKVDSIDQGVHKAGDKFDINLEYGNNLGTSIAAASVVHIHPDWASNVDGGFGIWYDRPDLAVVHFKKYVPVKTEDGRDYVEFSRPFFSGTMKNYEGRDVGVFGAKGRLRWARGRFDMSTKGYVVIDGSDWRTSDAVIEHGDSGGPWLYSNGGESSSERYVMDGVILGITSGPNLDASPLSWPPVDFFAMGLSQAAVTEWIKSVTNGAAIGEGHLPWRRQEPVSISTNGTGAWAKLPWTARNTGNVAVGQFGPHACDGGGPPRQDLFLTEHGKWWVSWCGETEWEPIRTSSTEIGDEYGLAFGDFDGDGITDVFRASEGTWKVSFGGRGPWQTIKTSSTRMTDGYGLAFGDFDGDGKTDVFRASQGTWKVSYGGTGPWVTIKSSDTELKDEKGLAFGDFDGDGKTDVFRASQGTWKVSYGGTGPWVTIKTSDTELTDKYGLVLGYFDADNKVDVLRANGTSWLVSNGGTGNWVKLKDSNVVTRRLIAGDLGGDKKSDVIRVRPQFFCHDVLGTNICKQFYYLNNTAPQR